MKVHVPIVDGQDGWLVGSYMEVIGAVSQGRTREELLRNMKEAIELCIEVNKEDGWKLSKFIDMVEIEVEG